MNPVHIAPLTAPSTARRTRGSLTRRTRLARRALLPLCMGSCALPLVCAHAQTAPATAATATAAPAKAAANTPPIVLAPAPAKALVESLAPLPVRALNRAQTSKAQPAEIGVRPIASPIALNTSARIAPTYFTATPSEISTSARIASARIAMDALTTDGPTAIATPVAIEAPRVVASASMAPVRLAQLRPKDTEAPATPRETGPQVLEVPVGPEVPITKEPTAPPPDTSGTPTRVAPPLGAGVIDTVPDQPALIGDVRAAEGREISDVRVVGSRVVPADTILAQVRSQRGAAFSSRQAQNDLLRINELGFFASTQAQVVPDLSDPNKTVVTYIVTENRVITGFEFVNNTAVKAEDITPVLTSKVGTVLNRNSVAADVTAVQKLYQDKGFAVVVRSAQQAEDGKLIFDLSEATISAINVIGLKKTRESLVRRQIRIKPGDTFDSAKMRQDLNRLYDTNFFDAVEPRVDDDPDEVGAVIVNFVFREKRTGQFQVGVGFDTRSRLSGFVTLSESNLRGSGQRGFASVEAGAQRNFELGTGNPFIGDKNASYDVSIYRRSLFRQPRSLVQLLTGNPLTNIISDTVIEIAGENITIPANSTLQEQRTGGRINFTRPLDYDRRRTLIFGYRNEDANARITNFNNASLTEAEREAEQANLDKVNSLLSSGRISALSLGFLRDSRDLRIDPSSGGRESLVVEQAFKFLGGNTNFTKVDLDLRRYLPVIKGQTIGAPAKLVVAGRVVLSRSVGQLPIFEQYFIGGNETVRGYNTEQQFGDNQLYGNFELRYRFQNSVTGVLFADTGTAYGGNFATSNGINLLSSFGIGVRLQTPIGPIRLDYGIGRDGGRTHFGIGPTF